MHYVFVPGAWHGGWAWHSVARRVRDAGHTASCLTLPGMNDEDDREHLRLTDATTHVVDAGRRHLEVVLVGHSLGGLMISTAAAQLGSPVARLVYVDAFVPTPGESMNDANPDQSRDFVHQLIAGAADGSVAVPDYPVTKAALMQDVPDAAAHLIHGMLTPTPGAYFVDPYPGPDVPDLGLPLRYVLAEADQGLPVPGTAMAQRLGVVPIPVPGTHEALLTHPDDVAEAVLAH